MNNLVVQQIAAIDAQLTELTEQAAWHRVEAKRLSQPLLVQAQQLDMRIQELRQMKAEWSKAAEEKAEPLIDRTITETVSLDVLPAELPTQAVNQEL